MVRAIITFKKLSLRTCGITTSIRMAALRLLENPGLRLRLGAAGRRYVRLHHRWETITAQLEVFYEQCRESAFVYA